MSISFKMIAPYQLPQPRRAFKTQNISNLSKRIEISNKSCRLMKKAWKPLKNKRWTKKQYVNSFLRPSAVSAKWEQRRNQIFFTNAIMTARRHFVRVVKWSWDKIWWVSLKYLFRNWITRNSSTRSKMLSKTEIQSREANAIYFDYICLR